VLTLVVHHSSSVRLVGADELCAHMEEAATAIAYELHASQVVGFE